MEAQGKARAQRRDSTDDASEFWVILGRRLKITNSCLVLFTALLFFAALWQGIQLRRTIDKMDEVGATHAGHMAGSVAEAKRGADEMGKLATTTKKSAQRQLRAYIFITPLKLPGSSRVASSPSNR